MSTSVSIEFIDMLLDRVAAKEQAALDSVTCPVKLRGPSELLGEVEVEQLSKLQGAIKAAMHRGLRMVCIPETEVPFGKLAELSAAGYTVRSTYIDHTEISWERPSSVQNTYKYY